MRSELEQWLVVERDDIQLVRRESCFTEAVIHCVLWEGVVVLLPCETLFLGRGDDVAAANEASRTVVVESRDSENIHSLANIERSGTDLGSGYDKR